jgi:nitroreductase
MTATGSASALHDVIFGRRSVRDFTGKKLDEATIRELLAAAVRAPTAVHEEPWRFLIVQDETALLRLSDRAKALFTEQVKRLHVHREGHALDAFSRPEFNVFYGAGTLIVICGRAADPFVAADCWLAAENLMLTAHAMGFGSCVIGSAVEALNAPDIKADLSIPEDLVAVAPVIVGIPADHGRPTARKAAEILAWR